VATGPGRAAVPETSRPPGGPVDGPTDGSPGGPPDDPPTVATLHRWTLWDLAVARSALGDKPLLVVDDDVLTYGALHESAGRLAAGLLALGVAPGDRVATLGPNCTDWVVVWFACAAMGAVWVPLNAALVGADLAYALDDSRPALLVVEAGLADRLAGAVDVLPGHVAVRGDAGAAGRTGDAAAPVRRPRPSQARPRPRRHRRAPATRWR
jgi:acyl-CoA synthetase (AMP-forming)/AMP-acid ligase II